MVEDTIVQKAAPGLKRRDTPLFERLAVIGPGLIGSSILRAAREVGLARTLVTSDASSGVRERARELGLADDVPETSAEAVLGADAVIICVPVGAIAAVAGEIAGNLKPGAIVSDVGSVKAGVIEKALPLLPAGVHLIPAHPVAGTEYSGPDSGFATLFVNRWSIITPPEGADGQAVAQVAELWEAMGANVEFMTAQHHDLVLAITSHVPHLIAYNIVGTAADLEEVTQSEVIKFSAGGFRDFTRIAASDPTMWRDVFLNNKEAVLEMLGRFNEDLAALARAIRWSDGDALFELFTRTRAIRRNIIELGQETSAPDFGRIRALSDQMEPSDR
ncbi:prephenate/arogenate dehydrogenase family protein [Pseudochelatococcus sp. B33]